jgi:acetamidase/formamidase
MTPARGPRIPTLDGTLAGHYHTSWRPDHPPVLEIDPGDTIRVRIPDSSTMQLGPKSTRAEMLAVDHSKVDAAVGPIFVRGVRPGDALRVEILRLDVGDWGWSGVFRKFGLIQDRFDDDLVIWKLAGGWARPSSGFLRKGVRIPLRPMLGVVGVAPASGEHPMIPPRAFGGNMDNRLHGAGATIELPVFRPGALLSVADPHARQGDGEVCGTGIETPAVATLRVGRVEGAAPPSPRVLTRLRPPVDADVIGTMGIHEDVRTACRLALEHLLVEMAGRGYSEKEAYLLASLLGDLRISEIVDEPTTVATLLFPRRFLDPPPG